MKTMMINGERVNYHSKKDRAKYTKEWRETHPDNNFKSLSEVVKDPETDLKVGDTVIFTNDYGVKFLNKIIGFTTPNQFGRCVYLDKDSYWIANNAKQIQKANVDI